MKRVSNLLIKSTLMGLVIIVAIACCGGHSEEPAKLHPIDSHPLNAKHNASIEPIQSVSKVVVINDVHYQLLKVIIDGKDTYVLNTTTYNVSSKSTHTLIIHN